MPKKSKGPAGLLVTILFVGAIAIANHFSGLGDGHFNAADIFGGLAGSAQAVTGGGW